MDGFLKKQFMGDNKGEKDKEAKEPDKTKETPAMDRAHRMLCMPEEIDSLHEKLKTIFREISMEFDNKNHELKDVNNRIKILEQEVAVLRNQQENEQ